MRGVFGSAMGLALLSIPSAGSAQITLTLEAAMARARTQTPEARALAAGEQEAAEGERQARAGYLPRVDLTTGAQRGSHPIFVFSSLLAQRRFTEANFAIASLNEPDPVNTIRTFVGIEQPIFDAGAARHAVRGARIEREMAELRADAARQDLALGAAEAFVHVLQAEAMARASTAAVTAAESDRARAVARQETGLATSADVLSTEVHLADARQREITARADVVIARLQLNVATGLRDETVTLVVPEPRASRGGIEALVSEALASHEDLRRAELGVRAADATLGAAKSSLLPRLDAQGGVEYNGAALTDQRSSWVIGAQLHINLFRGFADAARIARARYARIRAAAERDAAARRLEVDVRAAAARLEAAQAREAVGRAALAKARESHRIVRDRYETGLATITDVLRASEGVFDAESRATAAEMDVILQAIALDRALGRL